MQHRWFSGRMLACHAGGPGSIPGRCKDFKRKPTFGLYPFSPRTAMTVLTDNRGLLRIAPSSKFLPLELLKSGAFRCCSLPPRQ